MVAGVPEDVMRMLVRHQWLRDQEVPRVTVLVGGDVARTQQCWLTWLELSGRTAAAPVSSLDDAVGVAMARPRDPVVVVLDDAALAQWAAGRDDRTRALVMEGVIRIESLARRGGRAAVATGLIDSARSLAELTLFEALAATPATAGRFRLNQRLPFRFGPSDIEVDLLSREDAVAIEIDGIHHFRDPARYRRDRRKDLLLQAHGFAVLRFLAEDVLAAPADTVQRVIEYLGLSRRGTRDES